MYMITSISFVYVCYVDEGQKTSIYTQVLLLVHVLYNKTSIMKQLWSVLLTFALFFFPLSYI